ncbi:MAG: ABC-F family ATP-binding cassette domain-containing protein, partial [Spirochaetes bacterium]|nr:ABC-F family ATP-binding cassette domain-containing protein [Spirochaetota bacterium]
SKSFGDQKLFDNISFQINLQEKVGLVGRNGYGKTTLLRMLINEDEPDNGSISIPKNYKSGYVKQNLRFTQDTILKEGKLGLPDDEKNDLWKIEKILFGLGFNKDIISQYPLNLSGGFQVRLNLAKTLLSNPDLLLLDEPTNYLDITSIRWLTGFLQNWKGELILITHDRTFMDKIVTHIMAIHRKKIKKMKGATENVYFQIAKEEEIYEKERLNDEKKRKSSEIFISRFRAKARLGGLVQSRIKMLAKQGKKEKLEQVKDLDFRFRYKNFKAQTLATMENISFSYEKDKPLINDLSFFVGKKDRIAVVGPNGKGKSTLLRLMMGELKPNSGKIKDHNFLSTGYFGQTNKEKLHPDHTVEEEIALSHPKKDRQDARNICGALLFEGDDALKKINVISGGEKSRVLLGKILVSEVNMLLLDEPTNHLDMESCDALLAAIDDFEGAVVIVTHNEMFLHAIAERLIVFDGRKVFLYEGKYADFLNKIGWSTEEEPGSPNINENTTIPKMNTKELRKQKAEIIQEKSKVIKPIEIKIHKLEEHLHELENENELLQTQLIKASEESEGKIIGELSIKINNIQNKISQEYAELDKILHEHEAQSKLYDKKLNSIS